MDEYQLYTHGQLFHFFLCKEQENIYSISKLCKKQGFDPKLDVEMPIAKDVAERVEGLISVEIPEILGCGVAEEISELEKKYNKQDWRVAFEIAYQIACNKFINFSDKKLEVNFELFSIIFKNSCCS